MATVKKGFLKKTAIFLAVIAVLFGLGNLIGTGVDYISTAVSNFVNGKHKAEILSKVPEEFRSNYYFRWFGLGDCEYMTGDVRVTFVFVDDDLSVWTDDSRQNYKQEVQKIFDQIEADAATYGARLNLTVDYKTATSTGELSLKSYMDWINNAISSAGLPAYSKMCARLEKEYKVDHAPVIFCANRDGRCFARPSNMDKKSEFAVLFEDTDSLYHEFCHIFGAEDFYYPDEAKEIAAEHLPESLMNSNGKKVDSLTAFLIGWTDSLDDGATAFLEATNSITAEYMKTQYADETYTGYVENKTIGDTIYTGNLVDGILEGKGRKIRDGAIWDGNFKGGLLNGKGRYISSEGNAYTGDFVDGKIHGQGTYKWVSGNTYTGSFVNGKMHGQGTFRWSNGDSYNGAFVDGRRTGQGTYKWADGDTYVGEFLDGKLNGYGTLTYANGKVRKGNWQNGKFVG